MNFNSRTWAGGLLTVALAIVAVVVVNAQKDQRNEPLPAYFFEVEISGQTTFHFRSVSGLKIETDVVEYQEGGNNGGPIHKLAGVTRYANIRLTRAFTGDRALYDLFASTPKPDPARFNGRITMFDRRGTRVAAWKFINGFIVKWEGPDFDASKNEVAIESIEIAHEGLTLINDEN
jgi:phage tail-like protein